MAAHHRHAHPFRTDSATPPPEPPLVAPLPTPPFFTARGAAYSSAPPSPIAPSPSGHLLASLPNRIASGSPAISEDDEAEKKGRRRVYPVLAHANGKPPTASLFGDANYSPKGKRRSRFFGERWLVGGLGALLRWALTLYVAAAVLAFTAWLVSGLLWGGSNAGGAAPLAAGSWWPWGGRTRVDDVSVAVDGGAGGRHKDKDGAPQNPLPPAGPDVHPPVPQLPSSVFHVPYDPAYMFGHLADTLGARTVEQKLFQYALKPFAVMAFFTRAMTAPAEGAISIATLIDPSRYQRLSTLARAWNGHLSVALHLRPDEVDRQVAKLGQLIQSDAAIRDKCDIHLVITPHPRQLNLMRNVARLYSRTDLVVQLDADFVATTDVARHVDELGFRSRLEAGEIALVIPAFEWADDSVPGISHDPRDPGRTDPSLSSWPTTKREVVSHFQNSRLLVFHHQWAVGHGATDYQRWLAADEPYELDGEHHHSFEPYLVMRRDYDGSGMPYCDERLVGYGGNKAACVFEGHLGGVKLIVLPNDWVIHQRHSYPELERRSERSYNRRLYENIREEMCVRYNRMQTVDDAADGSVGEEDSIGCTRHCGPARKGGERKKK